jgi:hypothetical protein
MLREIGLLSEPAVPAATSVVAAEPAANPLTQFFGNKNSAFKKPKPGSAAAWIDELCPNDEWRTMTGKQLHQFIERKAKERKLNKWPSLRGVQNELAERKKQT